ncbi:MAG: NAD(P)/FAD-dependent oxidoreductase [Gemmatimonadaceae bacterium]
MVSTLDAFDAVVVGGGPAGLSAALALGRATRTVLLAACGPTRNSRAHAARNVFSRDGIAPSELLRLGREQLKPYDVVIRDECAIDIRRTDSEYVVALQSGEVRTRGIVLATGVRDVLPDIPGFQELWGTGVFHCPYCHGWEVANQPLAIYARGEAALRLTKLIRGWSSDLILFTDGPIELPPDNVQRMQSNGIVIREDAVERLTGYAGLEAVILKNGEAIPRAGLFVSPKQELRSDLPHKLGCAISPEGRVEADVLGRTSVPRVFVAGDTGPGQQSVISAAASGTLAGAGLNHDLLDEEF